MSGTTTLIVVVFSFGALASGAAWWTAREGQVCDRSLGYEVPARVARDPALRKCANDLVRRYSRAACLLSMAPVLVLCAQAARQDHVTWSTAALLLMAAYGLIVAVIATYPCEAIKRLAISDAVSQ